MLLTEFIAKGAAELENLYPSKEARSIMLILCEDLLGTKSYTHLVDPSYEIDPSKLPLVEQGLGRLCKGEPIQYVTGKAEFCGLVFRVGPEVLIPRPETELLCREAAKIGSMIHRLRIPYGKKAQPVRILDLCTGSGCIAWTMALSVPNSYVVGVDISDAALKVARSQNFSTQLREKGASAPHFVKADVLDASQDFGGKEFDIVLSNPPYVLESEKAQMRSNVLEFEPYQALFIPDSDPLMFHRAIGELSKRLLCPEGCGATEVNERMADDVQILMKSLGFSQSSAVKDFFGKKRFVFYKK